jgi:AbrB family looped-hinge helix DNA binding protein
VTIKVSHKGWVVIPADLRKKYDLHPGAELQVVDYGGVLTLVPQLTRPVQDAAGMLKGHKSLTQALLSQRRAERRKEKLRGR